MVGLVNVFMIGLSLPNCCRSRIHLNMHESNLYMYFVGVSVGNVAQLIFKTLANVIVVRSCKGAANHWRVIWCDRI